MWQDRRDDLPSSLSRLRGVAILGILLMNVELFRGPDYLLNLPYATAGLALRMVRVGRTGRYSGEHKD